MSPYTGIILPVMSRSITWVGYVGTINASRVSSIKPVAVDGLLLFSETTFLPGSKNKIKNALVKIMVKIIFHMLF
jgi:hypothetical protein